MNKLAIDRNAIDVIFISHFHADHIAGLPFFLLEANYVTKRTRLLTIVGPPGLKTRFPDIDGRRLPRHRSMELSFPLRCVEHWKSASAARSAPCAVTPFHVVHDDRAGPCLGFRFEVEGKVIAFSGDTEWTDTLVEIGRDADLFICEAYTRDKPIATHMALSLLEQHLGQIKPKRLVLTPRERRHAGTPRRGAVRNRRQTALIVEL